MTTKAATIKVTIGTRFRRALHDANPLWEVTDIVGKHANAIAIDEPFEHNGHTYSSDHAGTESSFLLSDIRQSIAFAQMWEDLTKKTDDFWASQTDSTVLHYHNSFGEYVRGEVVTEDGEKKLKPIALVGAWKPIDLPRRMADGTIYEPYHVRKIREGSAWAPSESCVYESPSFSGPRGEAASIDPRQLEPISFELPEPTADEQVTIQQEKAIRQAIEALQDYRTNPQERILVAMAALEEAPKR